MDLAGKLKELERYRGDGERRVLSLYLHTDRSSPDQQSGEWKIRLKNGLKRIGEAIDNSRDEEERKAFTALREPVEKEVLAREPQLEKGLTLFADPERFLWEVLILPLPVETDFRWETGPLLEPLRQLHRLHPRTGIVLVQNETVRVIETETGSVLATRRYEWDPETEDWKKHEGPHKADPSMGGGNNTKRDAYDDKYQAVQQRWLKSLAPRIGRMAKQGGWQRTLVTGEKGIARKLADRLARPGTQVLDKNLANRKDHEIADALLS